MSLVDNSASPVSPTKLPAPVLVSPATMNRIFKEAEEAFVNKD